MTASSRRFAIAAAPALAAFSVSCSVVTGGTPAAAPHSAGTAGTTSAAPAPSAQDQVRQTVTAFAEAYNTQNWDAYTELMCSAMRAQFTGPTMDYLKKGRVQNGLTTIKISTVTVTGDTATATMEVHNEALGSGELTLPLKLEDGWKVCKTS